MTLPYFIMDDTKLEDKLALISQTYSENKSKEEEKLEKSLQEEFMANLNLNLIPGTANPGTKTKGKVTSSKDKTPSSSKVATSLKFKKVSS